MKRSWERDGHVLWRGKCLAQDFYEDKMTREIVEVAAEDINKLITKLKIFYKR
ncbi:hypothetical protein C5S32_06305 [ANME-1 cluster archaeon GoMg1]|nr:hypothetical protein [ANME-1 cluster archaeon GoMg1]